MQFVSELYLSYEEKKVSLPNLVNRLVYLLETHDNNDRIAFNTNAYKNLITIVIFGDFLTLYYQN